MILGWFTAVFQLLKFDFRVVESVLGVVVKCREVLDTVSDLLLDVRDYTTDLHNLVKPDSVPVTFCGSYLLLVSSTYRFGKSV